MKVKGISFDEWLCLARCQGLVTDAHRSAESSLESFRAAVQVACASDTSVLCVAYSRITLGQAGDGHYSPIGAYDATSDHVLIMDVARFKHPPHWVPLPLLWEAMCRIDKSSGRSRGYAVLSRTAACERCDDRSAILVTLGRGRLQATHAFFREQLPGLGLEAEDVSAEEAVWRLVRSLPPAVAALVNVRDPRMLTDDQPGKKVLEAKHAELASTPLYTALTEAAAKFAKRDGPLPGSVPALTALLLVSACVAAEGDDSVVGTGRIATTKSVRAALGAAAPLVLDWFADKEEKEEENVLGAAARAGSHACGEALGEVSVCETLRDDVKMARAMLRDATKTIEAACAMECHATSCAK